jgi:hypothetical protein
MTIIAWSKTGAGGAILATYDEASVRTFLIDASGLVVLMVLAVKAKLYQWPRLRRLIAAGSM